MKKSTIAILCVGMLAVGFVLGKSCNMDIKERAKEPHEIQYFVDRIEEEEWVVVEIYDKTIDATMLIDIKAEEGYKVKTNEWTFNEF